MKRIFKGKLKDGCLCQSFRENRKLQLAAGSLNLANRTEAGKNILTRPHRARWKVQTTDVEKEPRDFFFLTCSEATIQENNFNVCVCI